MQEKRKFTCLCIQWTPILLNSWLSANKIAVVYTEACKGRDTISNTSYLDVRKLDLNLIFLTHCTLLLLFSLSLSLSLLLLFISPSPLSLSFFSLLSQPIYNSLVLHHLQSVYKHDVVVLYRLVNPYSQKRGESADGLTTHMSCS